VLLTIGADRLVVGAAAISRQLGIPPLLVGLTVVAIGTSAPEIFVAITAALHNEAELAIGNAIGSNIANIGFVLGLSSLITPLAVQSKALQREYPVLFFIMLLTWGLLQNGYFSMIEGVILLVGLVIFIVWLAYLALQTPESEPLNEEFKAELPKSMPLILALFWVVVGCTLLPMGSHSLVKGAIDLGKYFGISSLIIGLSVIAVGTSLPEAAAAIIGGLRGEHDIAVGNILGSNIFNLLAVLPFAGLIAPGPVSDFVLYRDLPAMFIFTIVLFFMAYGFRAPGKVSRIEGSLLLAGYIVYVYSLYLR